MDTRTIVIDGIPVEVTDAGATVIASLQGKLQVADAKLATVINIGDKKFAVTDAGLQTAIDAVVKEAADSKGKVIAPEVFAAQVAAQVAVIDSVRKVAPAVKIEGKDSITLQREALKVVAVDGTVAKAVADALLGDKTIDTADAAMIPTVFAAVAKVATTDAGDTTQQRSVVDSTFAAAVHPSYGQHVARDGGAAAPKITGRAAYLASQIKASQPAARQ